MGKFKEKVKNRLIAELINPNTDVTVFSINIESIYGTEELYYLVEDVLEDLNIPYGFRVIDNEDDFGVVFFKNN